MALNIPTTAPTAFPTKGIEAYVQYFGNVPCFSSTWGTAVVDSGSCTPVLYYTTDTFQVECESNSVESAWTAQIYTNDASCSGSTYKTISVAGACECFEFYDGYNFAINCGNTPMTCEAPPSASPTTASPLPPTLLPPRV